MAVVHYQSLPPVGMLAVLATVIGLMLLIPHRNDDLNRRSPWLCSRNDIIPNGSVLVAVRLVFAASSGWRDVVVCWPSSSRSWCHRELSSWKAHVPADSAARCVTMDGVEGR